MPKGEEEMNLELLNLGGLVYKCTFIEGWKIRQAGLCKLDIVN